MNIETQKKNPAHIDVNIPLYSPRTTYNIIRQNDENLLADLALNFDPFTINILKNEFILRKGELTLVEFVMILKEHLLNWQIDIPYREKRLIRCLKLLFEEIDLNGNGLLEWDEFTNYIIEKATVINNIKNKNEEIKNYTQIPVKINKKFLNPISKCIYIKDIDRLAVVEEESDEIYFLNHETGIFNPKPLKVAKPKHDNKIISTLDNQGTPVVVAEKSMILDILYISDIKQQFLITSSNDGAIRTWRYTSAGFVNAKEDDAMYFPQAQVKLAWDGINELLYTGQRDGVINIWDKKSERIVFTLEKEGHKDAVMDMIALPKLQLLASCSLDQSIILWNTIDNRKHREYREHSRGVVSLAFNEALILLISASFDHEIYVWNPYIANSIYKISAHTFPLINVRVIDGTNHFTSLDSAGNLKVWDFKKFSCLQTINLENNDEKHAFLPQGITHISKPLKLVITGRSIQFYEYDKNYNPTSVDETYAVSVCYVPHSMSILTPAGNKIKVWNALTGEVKKIYSDLTQSEITAFSLDSIKKRCLIGFASGEAAIYNIINGAKIKDLARHTSEITFILEARNLSYIITGSTSDGNIKIHTDSNIVETENIRTITINDTTLTALVYGATKKILITGTQIGTIAFWEVETGKAVGQPRAAFENEEITNINLIQDTNYIIVSSSMGKIIIMSKPSYSVVPTKIFTFYNKDIDTNMNLFVHNMVLCNKTRMLFISDEKGYLKAFDMHQIFDELQKDNEKKKQMENDPTISNLIKMQPPIIPKIDMNPIWISKAHLDPIKALEYVEEESIIITSGVDKRVKIWSSITGKFIDSLQQNHNKSEPAPIAIKRAGTEEIYTLDLDQRLDHEFFQQLRMESMIQATLPQKFQQNHLGTIKNMKSPMSLKRNSLFSNNGTAGAKSHQQDIRYSTAYAPHINNLDEGNLSSPRDVGRYVVYNQYGQEQKKPTDNDIDNKDILETINSIRDDDVKPKLRLDLNVSPKQQDGKRLVYLKNPEEEFNPYYNLNNINQEKLEKKESTKWRLFINFEEQRTKFESQILELMKKVGEEERKAEDFHKKDGLKTHFRIQNFNDNEGPSKSGLLDQEVENVKRQKEQERLREQNFKKILNPKKVENDIMLKKNQKSTGDLGKKLHSDYILRLHKKELKGRSLFEDKQPAYMTREEADAAFRLAAALSNYDKDDTRILKLLDVKVRNVTKKKNDKNFMEKNRNVLANILSSTALAYTTTVPRLPVIKPHKTMDNFGLHAKKGSL